MAIYALVSGSGVVVNTIIADAEFIKTHGDEVAALHRGGTWLELTDALAVKGQRPAPGWTFVAGVFAPPK